MAQIEIHRIPRNRHDEWEALWRAYLDFYDAPYSEQATQTTWDRFHSPDEPMTALGAFDGEELVGIVHYIYHRSTWTVENYCYLQDLFTREDARGRGVGRTLIEAVCERAKEAGAGRVYWLTQEANTPARALYDKLAERSGFIQYRRML
ncbi:MAG: GNAT family N-acetyltransferase [Salinarimonadaceae bacterium]|nr:MAG: GNAT family N-acetyltransferase [Salinarimonadaceae bacterium]